MVTRPDGDGGRERVAARRGDGGGRSDDAAAPRAGEAGAATHGERVPRVGSRASRRRSTCCEARAEPLGIELRSCDVGDARARRDRRVRRAAAVPGRRAAQSHDLAAVHRRARTRPASLVAVGDRSAGADARRRRRARWAPTSSSATRSASACRSATAARTRRSSRRASDYVRQAPGRIIGVSVDAHGQPRLPHGAADARAAHPPREGDVEHLHRAGAARQHGGDVRRVPRARRADGDRARACTRMARALDDALADARARADERRATSTRCASRARGTRPSGARRRAEARGINFRYRDDGAIGIALDETVDDATTCRRSSTCSPRRRASAPVAAIVDAGGARADLPAGAAPNVARS